MMKFKKGDKVFWNGLPVIIVDVITKSPFTGKPVKQYAVKYDLKDFASHLVSEDANTLIKQEATCGSK